MSKSHAVICSIARTPIGKYKGALSHLTAPQLGSIAIRGALSSRLFDGQQPKIVEAYMGNVLQAGIGQAPCRQAVLGAGLGEDVICTTVNKVCASGMKSIALAAQTIELGLHKSTPNASILAGGMESMSNTPLYLSRTPPSLGHQQILDGIIHDGLWDPYNNQHMGNCAEQCAKDYDISRQDQDRYAAESYRRAREGMELNVWEEEIVGVEAPKSKRGDSGSVAEKNMILKDEEPHSVNLEKLPSLRAAFQKDGTVTAGNASSINDGASALIIMDETQALEMGLTPLARIRGYGDAEGPPVEFTTAPSKAIPVAVARAGMTLNDIDYHEVNEAFSVVALANSMILNLDSSKVNVFGGAVALGHPIGMSGARIVGNLYNVLKRTGTAVGCASICNGGGGASAIVLERLN